MLIARAPFRISFAGGGTDLPSYFSDCGGMVVSSTINKYFYVILKPNTDEAIEITSADFGTSERRTKQEVLSVEGDLGYLKLILQQFGLREGVSVFTASEVLPGTGLGSSSTVAVALIKALSTLCGRHVTKSHVANMASGIEIGKLQRPIGLQDQYASSYGGLNVMRFNDEGVEVNPVGLPLEIQEEFEKNVMLFFTGESRDAAIILKEQSQSSAEKQPSVMESLHGIKQSAEDVLEAFGVGDIRAIGKIIHGSWEMKKKLAGGVSNPAIDEAYDLAIRKGADGGKIAGAGGGGYLLLICDPVYQEKVTQGLSSLGLRRMTFHFDHGGAQVLVNSMPPIPGLTFPRDLV
ncbi:MAG: GHMP kinase [Gemmatimonadetes bacterium]|nr:GHMP kinase [Gemmatimonadota bacterium]